MNPAASLARFSAASGGGPGAPACPACGATGARPRFTAGDFHLGIPGVFHVGQCLHCGLLFQTPRIEPELLGRHYPDDYAPYAARDVRLPAFVLGHLAQSLGYRHLAVRPPGPFARARAKYHADKNLIPRFVPDGSLLEIACASGARLALLRDLGWPRCCGIEFSESAAAAARARGFPVIAGRVEEGIEQVPDGSLDAVVAGFVLEHLEDPFALARRVAAKLKPGGQFVFSTLRIGAPDFRIYGKYWYNLDLPRHMVFFRTGDIRRMLAADFEVEAIVHTAAPNDYVGSARYRVQHGARHEPRLLDRLLLKAGNRIHPLCLALARLGLSSRVAVRCRKKA